MNMAYCPVCGTRLHRKEHPTDGSIPYCDTCGDYRFPLFSTAISAIVLDETKRRMLLIRQYGDDEPVLVAGYVDKGEMQLLKGYHGVKANVVDCPDFAKFIYDHMLDTNKLYEVGGKETYTYEEMAKMCFRAAGKPCVIKDSPIWMFGLLANLPAIKKAGKHDIILFSKWTLSHDLVGKDETGEGSFAEYIKEYFGRKE